MTIYSPKLIEEYVLETISRVRVIKEQCENLLSKDFASQAPKNLAQTHINICHYLETAIKSIYKDIDWKNIKKIESSFILLQTTDSIIREFGSHIRYIDGAQTQKVPWGLISPLEKYLKRFLSDVEILFRPQWKYNYAIIPTNLYEYYSKTLSSYETHVENKNLSEILKPLKKYFYIVSFPSIERENILLHCLLGHEIGHLEAKTYISSRNKEFLKLIQDKIADVVNQRIKKPEFKNVPEEIMPQIKQEITQAYLKETSEIWERGLEEILSDIVGSFLFGPAILFSNLEIALQDLNGLDITPGKDNNYYPPWRMRLRNIYQVQRDLKLFPLQKKAFQSKPIYNNVSKGFKLVENIIQEKSDEQMLKSNDLLKIAYEEIENDLVNAKRLILIKLSELFLLLNPDSFYKNLSHLIEKIDFGVPPNPYENSISKRKPAAIVEIINAAWFYKLSWKYRLFDKKNQFNENIFSKRERMNRLALKAIEYADMEKDYSDWSSEKNRKPS